MYNLLPSRPLPPYPQTRPEHLYMLGEKPRYNKAGKQLHHKYYRMGFNIKYTYIGGPWGG